MLFCDSIVIKGVDDIMPGNGNVVEAFFDDKCIGRFIFSAVACIDEDDTVVEVQPHIANVQPEFSNRGVGTKIITEVSKKYHVKFINACNNVCEDKNDIHYTSEGLAFMQHCCNLGIATNDCDIEARALLDDFDLVF